MGRVFAWARVLLSVALAWGPALSAAPAWADELEVKEDLSVLGLGGTLRNPNVDILGNMALGTDLHLHRGVLSTPYGGLGRYENLLLHSEAFDNATSGATWAETGITVTANSTAAPDGATTAETLNAGGAGGDNTTQTATGTTASKTFVGSVWLRTASGSATINLQIDSGNETGTAAAASVTTSWKRFSAIQVFTSGSTGAPRFIINNGTSDVIAWGAQLEDVTTAPSTQPGVYVQTETAAVAAGRGLVTNADLRMLNLSLAESGAVTFGGDTSLSRTGVDTLATGAGDSLQVNGNLTVTGTANLQGNVEDSTGNLTLNDSTDITGALTVTNNTAANTTMTLGSTGDFVVEDVASDTTPFIIDDTGNVGIGTSAPGGTLDVRGGTADAATDGSDIMIYAQDAGAGNQDGGNIILAPGNSTGGGGKGIVSIANFANLALGPGSRVNFFGAFIQGGASPNYLRFASSGGNDIYIPNSGNVGIGTTTVPELLTVQGRAALFETTAPTQTADYGKLYVNTADSKLYFLNDSGVAFDLANPTVAADTLQAAYDAGNTIATTSARDLSITLADTATDANFLLTSLATGNATISLQGTGDFLVEDAVGDASPFIITDEGNVGIGDASPDYLLELYDATDTPTLALSDDDIAHGVTTLAETDAFFHLSSLSTTDGGAQLTALADNVAGAQALSVRGVLNADPTDTVPAIKLTGHRASGTGVADLAAAETVFQVANNDDAAALTLLGNGNVGIGTTAPDGLLQVQGNLLVQGDRLVDADGAVTTGIGTPAAISESAALVAVDAADNLCTDSLTAPTTLRVDANSNCADTGADTALLGSGAGTVAATSAWAFADTIITDGAYTDGEDLYLDRSPATSYTSGNVGIGTTIPVASLEVVTDNNLIVRSASTPTSYVNISANQVASNLASLSLKGPGQTNTNPVQIWPISNLTGTSGTQKALAVTATYAPTSGTGVMNALEMNTTINQTGGANGITRGLYINPTLTAAADWRSLEIVPNSGFAIYQSGTSATNYLNGNTGIGTSTPSGKLDVEGGNFFLPGAASAPADGSFANSQWSLWLDEAANEFELKAKKADGTVFAQTMATVGASGSATLQAVYDTGNTLTTTSARDLSITLADTATDANFLLTSLAAGNTTISLQGTGDFIVQDQSSDTTPFIITDDGNVGIGTTAPAAKLEVAGTTSTIANATGNLNLQPAGNLSVTKDVALPSSKKVVLDSDDGGDSYVTHNAAQNYLSFVVDGVEVARFEP